VILAQIGRTVCPLIHLDGENVAIKIQNISVSENSGTNVVFTTDDNVYGTVVFAGCKYTGLRENLSEPGYP
jgi:leukemia inhibitory factor receptor